MPLDPSFRSRLRDALRQSAVRPPVPAEDASNPAKAGSHASERAFDTGPEEVGRHLGYETEEERQRRVDETQARWISDTLGGWWQHDETGVCLVVDRTFPADVRHGDAEIGAYAEALGVQGAGLSRLDRRPDAPGHQSLFAGLGTMEPANDRVPAPDFKLRGSTGSSRAESAEGRTPDDPSRFLFFDLETTGLSGGAGVCAFLVGFGWFDEGSFRTRQFFLSGFGHEAAMLRMASRLVREVTLVTFNGKTFDVPLIDSRYLYHRVPSPFETVPHVDLLHPARRLWRHRPTRHGAMDRERRDAFARYFRMTRSAEQRGSSRSPYALSDTAASCALGALEEAVLGFRRTGDVPGAEIAARFFHYVRSGDVRPLVPVLEHNRLDVVSLAALSAIVARMVEEGAGAARNAHECLALGHLFERSGSGDRAAACYERAVGGDEVNGWQRDPLIEREALRRLALRHRRERRYDAAAAVWQRLLEMPSSRPGLDFEAVRALAVHHEHRSRDLRAAHTLIARALEGTPDPRAHEDLRHRLARLERKLGLRG